MWDELVPEVQWEVRASTAQSRYKVILTGADTAFGLAGAVVAWADEFRRQFGCAGFVESQEGFDFFRVPIFKFDDANCEVVAAGELQEMCVVSYFRFGGCGLSRGEFDVVSTRKVSDINEPVSGLGGDGEKTSAIGL